MAGLMRCKRMVPEEVAKVALFLASEWRRRAVGPGVRLVLSSTMLG
jgi:hypothetical protein